MGGGGGKRIKQIFQKLGGGVYEDGGEVVGGFGNISKSILLISMKFGTQLALIGNLK